MTELTILMPCLNEAATVGTCIAKAREFLQRTGIEGEVLVADNGSEDDSRAVAERAGARIVRRRRARLRRGAGRRYRRGARPLRDHG